jgi:hypothetical protein
MFSNFSKNVATTLTMLKCGAFWAKKRFGRKNVLGEKTFWAKKRFGRKNVLGEKTFWAKKRFLGEKTFWAKKMVFKILEN